MYVAIKGSFITSFFIKLQIISREDCNYSYYCMYPPPPIIAPTLSKLIKEVSCKGDTLINRYPPFFMNRLRLL